MARFPAFNPLIKVDAVCSECGNVMALEVKRGPRNRVEKIIYRCENPESGCSYQVESDQRLNGMTMPIQKSEVRTQGSVKTPVLP